VPNSLCVYVGQGHLVETGDSVVSSSLHHGTLCVYVGQGHLVKIPYVSMWDKDT